MECSERVNPENVGGLNMKEIEQYIKKIVDHTDCTKEEKEDLAEELTVHLEILTEENMKIGMSEKDAIHAAIQAFGSENLIGRELQQAMFPYRRELLVTISLSFITMTFAAFTLYLIDYQEALNIQMIMNVCIGLGLLFTTISSTFNAKRKLIINSLLVLSLLGSIFNSLTLASSTNSATTLFLTFFNYAILIALVVMLYLTTLQSGYKDQPLSSLRKIVHFVNITFGLLLLAATLFAIWAFLFAGEAGITLLLLFIPLFIWMCLYAIQIRFQKRLGKLVYVFFAIYVLFIGAILYPYLLV